MATPTNKFYTIVNLNKYKEKFAYKNGSHLDKESLIDLKEIFDDNSTNNTIKASNNNPANTVPKGFYIASLGATSVNISQSLMHFELKGRTQVQCEIPNKYSLNFGEDNVQSLNLSIESTNDVGFGHGNPLQNTYQEFGNQILPGNISKIQETKTFNFIKCLKGATGGAGGGGGGRYSSNDKKGGDGGDSGNTIGVWIYPRRTNNNVNSIQFGAIDVGEGGNGGSGGNRGYYRGKSGDPGQDATDTSINFNYKNELNQDYEVTLTIEGSGGGGGGIRGKYNYNGENGSEGTNVTHPQMNNTTHFQYIINNDVSGVAGVAGPIHAGEGRSGHNGSKGEDGIISETYYLTGSNSNHKNTTIQ